MKPWFIGDTPLTSRFLLGTAGYPSPQILREAIIASGSQVLTLGLKRTLAVPGGGDNGFVDIIRTTAREQGAQQLPLGSTVADLLARLHQAQGLDDTAVATAVNGDFVARSERAQHTLHDGDAVLCFTAITGG